MATLASPPPSGHDDPAEMAAPASGDPMDALLEFAACMREHGVDMPDPAASGTDIGLLEDGLTFDPFSDEYQAATEACRELGPFGGQRIPPRSEP